MISFKDIPILIMKSMAKCLHNYPVLSGTFLVFVLLHLFFPFAFMVLLCTVPFFLAAFIVYTRFRFLTSCPPTPGLLDVHRDFDTKTTPKRKKPYISAQMSRRRNLRAKIEDPVPHKDKPMIDVSSPMKHFLSPDDSSDQDEQNLIWRNEKMIDERLKELKKNSPKKNSQIEEEEENMSVNRVLSWNEDDQKNLMDLGLSEIERNQRLENLIAKRRARKFLMAIRGPASVLSEKEVVRTVAPVKLDNLPSSSDDPIPGSAPSVLLPARNPFDIPYDPTEEKPNLRVDEFWGPQISRHESFTLGPSFDIDHEHHHHLYIDSRESRFGKLRRQAVKGDHDRFIEKLHYQQQEEDDSYSSTNKDEHEAQSAQQKDAENTLDDDDELHPHHHQGSSSSDDVTQQQEQEITQLLDKSVSSNPMKRYPTMYGSRDSYIDYLNHKVAHNLTQSIASDMQVEVSEPGSPSCNIITPMDLQSESEEMDKEKQEEQEVIEIGPTRTISLLSLSPEEDGVEGDGRDRRQISCDSFDQVVENPEEEAILFVDNSDSMPSSEQAAGVSTPSLHDNPEEINNKKLPVDDDRDNRNNIQGEDRNQAGHDIISDTRKFDDEEYINLYPNSVDVIRDPNDDGQDESRGDYEALMQQLKSEPLESQPSSEQAMAEPMEGSQAGVSHAPIPEQLTLKPVEGSRGEASLEEEELVDESRRESQAESGHV